MVSRAETTARPAARRLFRAGTSRLRNYPANAAASLPKEVCSALKHPEVEAGADVPSPARNRCFLVDGRNEFSNEQGLNPFLASTRIQATLYRPEVLVEIEAMAMFHVECRECYFRNPSAGSGPTECLTNALLGSGWRGVPLQVRPVPVRV